jgi:hypothetical protein
MKRPLLIPDIQKIQAKQTLLFPFRKIKANRTRLFPEIGKIEMRKKNWIEEKQAEVLF